jgi:hypothetical protein
MSKRFNKKNYGSWNKAQLAMNVTERIKKFELVLIVVSSCINLIRKVNRYTGN